MALETTKTTYLNGSSKDGNRVLANFSSSLSESGTMTINETISESTNLDTVEADFNEFRELAKNELKKLNGQDTETYVSSDKPADKEVVTPTSDNEAVKDDKSVDAITKVDDKPYTDVSSHESGNAEVASTTSDNKPVDDKPVDTTTKADDKPETGTLDETKASDVKDSEEAKQPAPTEEPKQPATSEEVKEPASPAPAEETKQPVVSDEPKQPASSEETNQPISGEEVKQPVVSDEVKVSDVKDGETVDESN